MKVEEYSECRGVKCNTDLVSLFEILQREMEEEFIELEKKEEMRRIHEEFEAEKEEDVVVPVRKNSSFEAEMAA